MSRSWLIRGAVTGLAFCLGFGLTYAVFEASQTQSSATTIGGSVPIRDPEVSTTALPDPLARRSTPARSLFFVVFLFAVAMAVLWLGRRRALEPEEEIPHETHGPRLIFDRDSGERRRSPEFYEDLRRRETRLESLEEKGPERRPRKIIELPVGDRRSASQDRQPGR